MKKTIILLAAVCITALLQAKTVNVTTAGTLSSYFTVGELTSTTDLTITGTIDARDLYFIREQLTALSNLDISATAIVEYTGTDAYDPYGETYKANALPFDAFLGSNISSIKLPTNLVKLGDNVFKNCFNLFSIVIPESVVEIEGALFSGCSSLKYIQFNNPVPCPLNALLDGAKVIAGGANPCYIYLPVGTESAYGSSLLSGGWDLYNTTYILMEGNIPTGISQTIINKAFVVSKQGNKTLISGLQVGERLDVYNSNGISYFSDTVKTASIALSLPSPGVYIIKTAGAIQKIVV